jgi:hypothetical protein
MTSPDSASSLAGAQRRDERAACDETSSSKMVVISLLRGETPITRHSDDRFLSSTYRESPSVSFAESADDEEDEDDDEDQDSTVVFTAQMGRC